MSAKAKLKEQALEMLEQTRAAVEAEDFDDAYDKAIVAQRLVTRLSLDAIAERVADQS